MNEKELRELEYEREMQEQAEYMSRWKLRKEIKKKLRALRKKIKVDEASLPQLQIIDKDLATLVDSRTLEALRILEEKGKNIPAPQSPTIIWQPCHTKHYMRTYAYDPRMVIAPSVDRIEDVILKEMAEEFGYELLKAGAIQYRIYDNAIIEHKKQVEMKVDVVVEDTPRENPTKYVNSPTLPIRKCPG